MNVIYSGNKYNSLKCDFDVPIYSQHSILMKNEIDRILLSATVEIESSAWKHGKDREEFKAQDVDVSVTFVKNSNGAWEVSDGDKGTTNDPFKYVLKQATIGKLDFAIRMNYDFLLDGAIVKNHKTKK